MRRAWPVLSLPSSASVFRVACLYRRVIPVPRPLIVVRLLRRFLASPRCRRGLRGPASIVSSGGDGLCARSAMKKNGGGFSFPVPLLCLLVRCLAAADYSAVSSDFVVALAGFAKAGLAVLVRVELDGDGGLVLVGGGLLACLAVREKHYLGPFIGRGFVLLLRCLNTLYGLGALPLRLFPYLWR